MGEEATLLVEELGRLRTLADGEHAAEYAAVLKLIDGLRPLLSADILAECEALATSAPPTRVERTPSMMNADL